MKKEKIDNSNKVKKLSDDEMKNINAGIKVAIEEEEQSWFRTLLDFFFKIND